MEWDQWKSIREEKLYVEEEAGMEKDGNGKEILTEKEKGKVRKRRRWGQRVSNSWNVKGEQENGGGRWPREKKKKCMLEPEQRNGRNFEQEDLWWKEDNCKKSRRVKWENEQWKHEEKTE